LEFGVLNTLFTSTWSSSGICCVVCGHFRGTCCLHPGVAVGRSGYGDRVDQGRVQVGPTGSGGWVCVCVGGGVSCTSKSGKKQNGTIENSVYEWSELENSQKKGWPQHGVPVKENEWRNTNKIWEIMCVCIYIYIYINENINVDEKDGKQEG